MLSVQITTQNPVPTTVRFPEQNKFRKEVTPINPSKPWYKNPAIDAALIVFAAIITGVAYRFFGSQNSSSPPTKMEPCFPPNGSSSPETRDPISALPAGSQKKYNFVLTQHRETNQNLAQYTD
ncbi:MAG: hypothetical protein FJZ64_00115 [Chlamydiae bacterium]|nr:hypothetical protein [Chlamydiota bacterium]